MTTAHSYRGHAAECLKLARGAFSDDARHSLLEIAARWLALADKVEKRTDDAEGVFQSLQAPSSRGNAAEGKHCSLIRR